MRLIIPIYYEEPYKKPRRVFDVETDNMGRIHKYLIKNIQGLVCVDSDSVQRQIADYLQQKNSA